MMGGKIDCYLDISSFYSYVAFADLLPNLDKLAAYGVQVEFHPVLIGAINHISGNQPPWKVPAKGEYLARDVARATARVKLASVSKPDDFLAMAHTVSPNRALHYIKANYSTSVYLSTMATMFHKFWTPPHVNLRDDGELVSVLRSVIDKDGCRAFETEDVERIMEGRAQMKVRLTEVTGKAVETGAFGAPWLIVRNEKDEEDVFFGSDRFNHIYRHLGVPFQDVAIQPPAKL